MFDYEVLDQFIINDEITDINYNGRDLWVDHLADGRIRYENFWSEDEALLFCYRLSNYVNQIFNPLHPVLESEIDQLRVSCLHPSVAKRLCISIRKTPSCIRIKELNALKERYFTKSTVNFLKRAVSSNCNILVSGLPGSGKTELIKFLMTFVNSKARVITIEDTLELHLSLIHSHLDSVSIKVNDSFDYERAIKASLRLRPDWLCVSEVRSKEVSYLLQAVSTGTHMMSTLHAQSALSIPSRLLAMYPSLGYGSSQILHSIYDSIDIGIHIETQVSSNKITRRITQICSFELDDQMNTKTYIHYDGCKYYQVQENKSLLKKMKRGEKS